MDVKAYLKQAYKQQFQNFYFKKPTKEQLDAYMDFYLRKKTDIRKVVDICQVSRKDSDADSLSRVDKTSREKFKRMFMWSFIFEPDELQLDAYISYHLGVIPYIDLVYEVTKEKIAKEAEQVEKSSI